MAVVEWPERLGALIEAAADAGRRGSLEQALATLRANAAKVEDEVGAWFQRWASWGWILDVEAR